LLSQVPQRALLSHSHRGHERAVPISEATSEESVPVSSAVSDEEQLTSTAPAEVARARADHFSENGSPLTDESEEARALANLTAALDEGRYSDVLRLFAETTWTLLRAPAATVKSEAILALSRQPSEGLTLTDRLATVDEQLLQMPEQVALYQAKSELLFEQGLIDEALAALAAGEPWMRSTEDLAALDQIRLDLQRQQLTLLAKNHLWAETLAFVDRTALMNDPDLYVDTQKALAQAHAGLLNWDEAAAFLDNASIAAPEDSEVDVLRQVIRHQAQRATSTSNEDDDAQWVEIPARAVGNALVVTATLVNGRSVDLLLDTGASVTAVDARYFNEVGGQALSREGGARMFLSAAGRFEAPVRVLEHFSVGALNARNLEVALIDHPSSEYQGLLGMNFLKFFELAVDAEQNLLRLRMK
ncbi:MAG: retroviral-like aspartic protease family protein, partial [Gammaproteobacteria bacterium]